MEVHTAQVNDRLCVYPCLMVTSQKKDTPYKDDFDVRTRETGTWSLHVDCSDTSEQEQLDVSAIFLGTNELVTRRNYCTVAVKMQ